jgi:acyl carrier protein
LALDLEETFDVELPDEVVRSFDTVGDIVRYMRHWSLDSAETDSPALVAERS